ncbi:MAG: hypothetical protein RMH75_06695 [Archaeoglobaceae archaeon]|nr:hypothetical protein [Archaeoglobaceae archaeon]
MKLDPIELENLREKSEMLFREEYKRAMLYLNRERPNLHPKKKIEIARKIARASVKKFLEPYHLCIEDLHFNNEEIKLEDLV